ncbi:MAG: 30S ribosomal protein S9 [Patescibacteria group bacterium]
MQYISKIGRRKSSVARAKLYPGQATSVTVNGKEVNEYFPAYFALKFTQALKEMNLADCKVELFVKGGGMTGQAEACRLALAKTVVENNADMKPVMRSFGWVTTDPRKVYSKRPGLKKARKAPQWVKR